MTRVPSIIMKWALLYAIQAGHAVIEVDDLARGQLVGDYLMQTAELVPSHISKTPVARVEAKIMEALAKERSKWLAVSSIHQLVSGRIKAQELRQSWASGGAVGVAAGATTAQPPLTPPPSLNPYAPTLRPNPSTPETLPTPPPSSYLGQPRGFADILPT